ncbi:phage tail assembly chaperone [Pseudomonas protegens]|uniref:phage tail assembly chaperone n=1 Tax=Pseudomonas TaxID=286 RepID=UPI0004425207|nr:MULTISPECIES: phage tail assembly chaperone [Pseudomonas]MCD9569450.1 phage tail assembly chaperone [Pseudomonas protegens]MCS4261084.1 hypothetical protein [Pseudomonas sp. BIGb0176]ROQ61352.1 phage tail assembly chaperone [Pseudomonas protegens]ROQ83670.1 phage tail assembly chaperone [Pseudomonas protegens]WRV93707.1 phage tail assembly chaperone [Pseudomonas protegens]
MKHLQVIDGIVRFAFEAEPDKSYWTDIVAVADDDARYLNFLALQSMRTVDPDTAERAWRDAEIVRVTWVRDRHRDEVELAIETTITAQQYAELLSYIRALRDWPAGAEFPAVDHRPLPPDWIAEQSE